MMEQAAITADDYLADRHAFLEQVEDARIRELIDTLGPYPYDLQQLFPRLSGFGARGDVKQRVRMIRRLEPRFEHLIYPGEIVEFVTRGMLSSAAERYFLGIVSWHINRTLFVFTNYRVLLINATGGYKPKQMQWQIPYDQIVKYKPGNFISSTIVFQLRDGKNYKFTRVPKVDRKSLREYVNSQVNRVKQEVFEFPHYRSRDPLCPSCSSPVKPKQLDCEACQASFINPMKPAVMSLVLPCAGDLYLGHYMLAVGELAWYLILWAVWASLLLDMGSSAWPIILSILAIEHVGDAAVTYYVAQKGVMLRGRPRKLTGGKTQDPLDTVHDRADEGTAG